MATVGHNSFDAHGAASSLAGAVTPAFRFVPLAGRVLLSLIFLAAGAGKLMDWTGTQAYMESHGMPLVPVLLVMAVLVEIGGGLAVLLGYQARWGALALLLFLIPATLIFHNFWAYDGMARQAQMQNFLKNLAIMGGLLLVVGFGPGPLSLDAWRTRRP